MFCADKLCLAVAGMPHALSCRSGMVLSALPLCDLCYALRMFRNVWVCTTVPVACCRALAWSATQALVPCT